MARDEQDGEWRLCLREAVVGDGENDPCQAPSNRYGYKVAVEENSN
jgi:hypothetical protein